MSTPANNPADWLACFPALARLSKPGWREALAQVRQVEIPAGTPVFHAGDPCTDYLFVSSGTVRVASLNPEGREIVLYRVEPGQTCVLTTSCLMGETAYPAEGVTESPVSAAIMPGAVFHRLLATSEPFRRFVFGEIAGRMARLMGLVQEIAFDRTSVRLAKLLTGHAPGDGTLDVTHAQLAVELGTAREVVSRLLKGFERNGWVALSRHGIRLINRQALAALAESAQ